MTHFRLLLACLFTILTCSAHAESVKLTSLDWPPYTSDSLTNQGASVAVAKAAFDAVGYKLEVTFFPWKRAVQLAKDGSEYDGYFPEYYAEELKQTFLLSDPMGSGPLGFAELVGKPVSWSELNDLKKFKIGVVSGYVNTAEFDLMVSNGVLKVSKASDDIKNLLKLAAGRVDMAVVDKHVMSYLLKSEKKLMPLAPKIKFNGTMLEDKQLYICFKKGARGEKLVKAFNEGLTKIDVQKIMATHLSQ